MWTSTPNYGDPFNPANGYEPLPDPPPPAAVLQRLVETAEPPHYDPLAEWVPRLPVTRLALPRATLLDLLAHPDRRVRLRALTLAAA